MALSDMRDCRNLDELLPVVKSKAIHAIAKAEMRTGLKIIVTCTYRSNEMQRYLYEQGRTREGPKITNDPGPGGPHYMRLAIDIAPAIKDDHGLHLVYNTTKWNQIADAFKEEGFCWGGDWEGFRDLPHFQYTKGKTIKELRQMSNDEVRKFIETEDA